MLVVLSSKNDVAIQKALISQQKPNEGYMKCPFLRILHEYNTYKDARFGLRKSEITSDLESNKEECLKSSRGRYIKRKFEFYKDNEEHEEDDYRTNKTSVKAPPVISFPGSDSESSMDQAPSKTKSHACSVQQKGKNVEKTSKKSAKAPSVSPSIQKTFDHKVRTHTASPSLLEPNKYYKRNAYCREVREKYLNQNSRVYTTLPSNQSASCREAREKSLGQNSRVYTALPSIQSASCREAREKSLDQNSRVYTALPSIQSASCRKAREKSLDQNSRVYTALPSNQSASCREAREQSFLDQNSRAHTSPSLLEPKKFYNVAETHMSASQSLISSQSVNDSDISTQSLVHNNIADFNISESDIEDSNIENLQSNNNGDKCAHNSSDNNYTESSHDNKVLVSRKITGIDMVRNLVFMVKIIKETQRNHEILLEEIVQRLRNKGITLSHPKGMPQIPLENINAAEKMEECLASTAQMKYLTKRLSAEDGTSVQGCVDCIMKKLLTRVVGSLYSYMGRKQKEKDQKLGFSHTNMCKVVKDAVLLVYPDANGRIIDKAILDFLRYSPFRSSK